MDKDRAIFGVWEDVGTIIGGSKYQYWSSIVLVWFLLELNYEGDFWV